MCVPYTVEYRYSFQSFQVYRLARARRRCILFLKTYSLSFPLALPDDIGLESTIQPGFVNQSIVNFFTLNNFSTFFFHQFCLFIVLVPLLWMPLTIYQHHSGTVQSYEMLVHRANVSHLDDVTSKKLIGVYCATLKYFDLSFDSDDTDISDAYKIKILIKRSLPQPSSLFEKYFFKMSLMPEINFKNIANLYQRRT